MTTTNMIQCAEEWADKYQPTHYEKASAGLGIGDVTAMNGYEIRHADNVLERLPAHIWTVDEGDEGELIIIAGHHHLGCGFFVTQVPWETEGESYPWDREDENYD